MSQTIELCITYRAIPYNIALPQESTWRTLQTHLEELTSVPPPLQKLLFKGKPNIISDDCPLQEAGLKSGMKITMLGTTEKSLEALRKAEDEGKRRDTILRQRQSRPPVKVRSTATASSAESLKFRFHRIEPLSHLPNPPSALAVLTRLSQDRAIQHVMQTHHFSVGLLTELAPHEHPNLLGLNENRGEAIKLRIRTDNYQGFRPYSEVRRVLCHELTHCVWGDHDNNFKELNSKLNREVAEFERAVAAGTHTLQGPGEFYEPSASNIEAEAHVHVLGGGSLETSERTSEPLTREQRRQRILEATLNRLKQVEQEIEEGCGNIAPKSAD